MIKKFYQNNKVFYMILCLIAYFMVVHVVDLCFEINDIESITALVICFFYVIMLKVITDKYVKEKKVDFQKIFIGIIVIGIIIRTAYILYTPITKRQHDMEPDVGHLAYIKTIYDTGKLPDSNKWQFYQQPFHHILSALWLRANTFFGVEYEKAEESLQILTAFYSCLTLLISYLILKELNYDDTIKVAILAVIAVHPTMIILSGSVNNDMLMVLFVFTDLLYIIKWNKDPSWKNTIILALSVAFGAITRIASTIVAFPILYIFINKFMKEFVPEKKSRKKIFIKYAKKFIVFGVISLSIGLSYSIRNYIKFNQSIFYVPDAGWLVYCGDRSIFERFFIISKEFTRIFCNPYDDCNIYAYLIKCSLFGEFNLNYPDSPDRSLIVERLLIIFNILIISASIYSLIVALRKKEEKDTNTKMLMIFYFSELMMYLYGNISKPFACTMDFRYIVPNLLIGLIFIAENYKESYKPIICASVIFCILSLIFELSDLSLLIIL